MASSRVRVIKMGTHGWNPDLVCKVRPADRIQYPKGIPRASLWRRRETLQASGFSGSQPRHDRWVFALHLPWEVNWKEIDFLEHLKPRRVILWEIQMSSTSKRKHASTKTQLLGSPSKSLNRSETQCPFLQIWDKDNGPHKGRLWIPDEIEVGGKHPTCYDKEVQDQFPFLEAPQIKARRTWTWGFPGGTMVKNPPVNAGDARDASSIPGSGRSLRRGCWQPAPVFLPEKFHRQRSLVGDDPWSHKELDMTDSWDCTQWV